jgi:hypothetical protein
MLTAKTFSAQEHKNTITEISGKEPFFLMEVAHAPKGG